VLERAHEFLPDNAITHSANGSYTERNEKASHGDDYSAVTSSPAAASVNIPDIAITKRGTAELAVEAAALKPDEAVGPVTGRMSAGQLAIPGLSLGDPSEQREDEGNSVVVGEVEADPVEEDSEDEGQPRSSLETIVS
jgi:hypothetical protein